MAEGYGSTSHQRDLPAGTVTILFTDIQGSTDLLKQLGDDSYVALVSEHHKLMRQAITRYGGAEVRIQGDSFFVTFARAPDAVAAAVDAQRAMADHEWPSGVEVLVRMGLHTGQPWVAVEDYEGIDIHRAARIASTGHGGQVLLSETTTSLVRDDLPEGVTLKDLGLHRLKDMRRAEQISQLVIPGLTSEFPPIRTLEALPVEPVRGSIRGYELLHPLGKGVFGEVYLAHQASVKREVAIKTIVPEYANDPDFIRRFEAEAQVVASLEHPHIVPLHDYWREPDGAYLVMRYLRGGSLEDALSYGPWQGDYAARLVEQIASGLAYAHRQGVVHRDIKPANILLDETGNAYLSDFGIATLAGTLQAQLELQALEEKDRALYTGSLGYQSPEVAAGEPATSLADIYSLGVVLYQLVTAKHPYPGLSGEALVEAHRTQPLPPVVEVRPDIPAAVDRVIQKATAKELEQRYPDALQLAAAFKSAILAEALEAPLDMPLEVENPYKGLRAFQETDASEFFGRTAMIQRLVERLDAGNGTPSKGRFLAVVGPSGSGKSSLVRAGLVPALRKGAVEGADCWFILDMIPGAHPYEELEAALLRVAVNPPASLLEQLRSDERGLVRAVKRCLPPDEEIELLLVVDQFEELFTLVQDPDESRRFLDCLYAAVIDPASRVRVVITLRADFYDRPLMHPDFSALVQEHTEVVVPLTSDELSEAVEQPAMRVGAVLEPGLAARIVTDVHGEPGALPLLQYALTELFDHRDNGTLTQEAYQEIGGVLGALGKRAEDTYQSMDRTAQSAARQLFLRLVTLGEGTVDTRRRVLRSELEALGASGNPTSEEDWATAVGSVIGLFGRHRLLTFDRDPTTREPTVEVAHEALLSEWSRLGGWLDESRADVRMQRVLGNAAADWVAADRDASFLLRGARLEQFEGWAASTDLALTADERAYLDASTSERKARQAAEAERLAKEAALERRSRNVLRALVAVFAVAAVIAVVLSLIAFNAQRTAQDEAHQRATAQAQAEAAQAEALNEASQRATAEAEALDLADQRATAQADAEEQRENAEQEREEARRQASIGLASQAIQELNGLSPDRAVPLALEALEDYPYTWQAERALSQSVLESRIRKIITGESIYYEHDMSPDGSRLLAGRKDETITVYEIPAGTELLQFDAGDLYRLAWSPDGEQFLGASSSGYKIWDESGNLLLEGDADTETQIQMGTGRWEWLPWAPDGDRFVLAEDDGTARVIDVQTGDTIQVLEGHQDALLDAAWSPLGNYILTSGSDKAVLWDAKSGGRYYNITLDAQATQSILGWSPTEQYFALAGEGLHVYEARSGRELFSKPVENDYWVAEWSPDEQILVVTSGYGGDARAYDPRTGENLSSITDLIQGFDVTWSPSGELVAVGGVDGSVRIWDPRNDRELLKLYGMSYEPRSIFWTPDGDYIIATGAFTPSILVFDLTAAELTIQGPDGVAMANWSPDGSQIARMYQDGTVKTYDASTGEELLELDSGTSWGPLVYSPEGDRLLTANTDDTIRIWDTNTGELLLDLVDHHHIFTFSGDWSPDGKRVVTSGHDGRPLVWDARTGEHILTFEGHADDGFGSVAWSPDGTRIISTSGLRTGNGKAIVWDADTGEIILDLFPDGEVPWVAGAEWSGDGSRIVVFDGNEVGHIFDAQTGEDLMQMYTHDSAWFITWSPTEERILSVGGDGYGRVWDAETGVELISYNVGGFPAGVYSPDGTKVLLATGDGTTRVFPTWHTPQELIDHAKECCIVRELTPKEREQFGLPLD